MRQKSVLVAALCVLSLWSGSAAAQTAAQKEGRKKFRVCADPENLPFSNQKLEGFENKIAELFAKEFGADGSHVAFASGRGRT